MDGELERPGTNPAWKRGRPARMAGRRTGNARHDPRHPWMRRAVSVQAAPRPRVLVDLAALAGNYRVIVSATGRRGRGCRQGETDTGSASRVSPAPLYEAGCRTFFTAFAP